MTCRARGGELGHWQWEPALALALAAHLSEMTWVATVLPSACCRRQQLLQPQGTLPYSTTQHPQGEQPRPTPPTCSSMSHHHHGPRRKRKKKTKGRQDIQGQPSRQVYSTQSFSALNHRPQDGAQPRVRFDVGHDKIRACVTACASWDVSRRRLGLAMHSCVYRVSCVVRHVSYNCASEAGSDNVAAADTATDASFRASAAAVFVSRVSSLKSASLVV